MNLEKLKADYPDLHAQVMNEGRADIQAQMDAAIETAKTETTAALAAVKAGCLDIVAVVLGDDARTKLDQVMASGMTAEQVKIGKELFGKSGATGELTLQTTREQILSGIQNNTPSPAASVATDVVGNKCESFLAKVSAYQAEHNCKRSVAMGAIAASDTELYNAWLKDQQK